MKNIEKHMMLSVKENLNLSDEEVLMNIDSQPEIDCQWTQHLPKSLIYRWNELGPQTRLTLFYVGAHIKDLKAGAA